MTDPDEVRVRTGDSRADVEAAAAQVAAIMGGDDQDEDGDVDQWLT